MIIKDNVITPEEQEQYDLGRQLIINATLQTENETLRAQLATARADERERCAKHMEKSAAEFGKHNNPTSTTIALVFCRGATDIRALTDEEGK